LIAEDSGMYVLHQSISHPAQRKLIKDVPVLFRQQGNEAEFGEERAPFIVIARQRVFYLPLREVGKGWREGGGRTSDTIKQPHRSSSSLSQ